MSLADEFTARQNGIPRKRPPTIAPRDATATKAPDPVLDKLTAKEAVSRKSLSRVANAMYGHDLDPGYLSAPLGGQLDSDFRAGVADNGTAEGRARAERIDQQRDNAMNVDAKASTLSSALRAYKKNRGPR